MDVPLTSGERQRIKSLEQGASSARTAVASAQKALNAHKSDSGQSQLRSLQQRLSKARKDERMIQTRLRKLNTVAGNRLRNAEHLLHFQLSGDIPSNTKLMKTIEVIATVSMVRFEPRALVPVATIEATLVAEAK